MYPLLMSLPTRRQAYAFLEPLRGKSAIFLVKSRNDHAAVSRFILDCLAASSIRVAVLDTSCFYGVNIRKLAGSLPGQFLQQSTLLQQSDDMNDEDALTDMVASDASAILMDDLNAALHLLSSQGQKSGIHRLSTFYHILSYSARINRLLVLGFVYKGDSGALPARSTKRSLPKISDLQVTCEVRDGEIVFRCDGIGGWSIDGFRIPLYFEPRT
jgi:hypothetical protein